MRIHLQQTNGTVVVTGSNDYGKTEVNAWKDIVSLAAGSNFTVGLKSDGTVLAIGKDCAGILDVSDWTNVATISVSFDNILGHNDLHRREESEANCI